MAAAFEVYNTLGYGFLEEVYQDALEVELERRGIEYQSQPLLNVYYKNFKLNKYYRPDLFVSQVIVVELKAIPSITSVEEAQLLNYLKATGKAVGYLINWGNSNKLEWKRYVYNS
ncbi:GxxExxY protein [Sedimentisphaera cyanobacteriorum]|uniref:GxxExxY protein n=2 Tax=Sedimentisphaera cyanobacteriorum TaxID=1940790 RepID=A0A1Q2HNW4_9BACT|nr:GxxExxY protein [Sedimentisphaera cyanobacteriorum]